jgi:hypothetical protein
VIASTALPFQFARADEGGIISMPGIRVTRKEDGSFLVVPPSEPVSLAFPMPTGEFSRVSNSELQTLMIALVRNLRDLQLRTDSNVSKDDRINEVDFMSHYEKCTSEYKREFADSALSLASECLSRLGSITMSPGPGNLDANMGGQLLLRKAFAGARPASNIADFLDQLQQKL